MKKVTWLFVIMLFGFCVSQPAFAKDSDNPDEQKKMTEKKVLEPWPNFELDVGMALTTLSSRVRFGTNTGAGLDVDIEDALDIDSSSLVWFAGGYVWRQLFFPLTTIKIPGLPLPPMLALSESR